MLNNTNLVQLFNKVAEVVHDWRLSSEPTIRYRGAQRKCISEDVFDALDNLASVSAVENTDVHAGARRLLMLVDGFTREWASFTAASQAGADVNPAGSSEVWAAFERIRDGIETAKFPRPEPIEQLVRRENVPAWQVAKIYGWVDSRGTPLVAMVQEELEKPGTHYDPDKWVHPAEVALQAEIESDWASRQPIVVQGLAQRVEETSASPQVAPESLETLIQQRVPVEQIAKMKQISIGEVETAAAGMGVVLQGARFVRPATQAGIYQEQIADAEARDKNFERDQAKKSADEKAAVSKKIRELRKAGKSPAEIQEILAGEFPSLDASTLAR